MLSARQKTSSSAQTVVAVGATAVLVAAMVMLGDASAQAAPGPETIDYSGSAFSTTVPAGVCSAQITALGGGGGGVNGVASPISALDHLAGAGARITASFPVRPGMTVNGDIGSGGDLGSTLGTFPQVELGEGGYPNGGNAGLTGNAAHTGGGGGGSTAVFIDGIQLIVAGGGGGIGGGHSLTATGGDAGLPSAAGVSAGSDGQGAFDIKGDPSRVTGGGQGGQVSGPGLGGQFVASTSDVPQAVQDSLRGFDGVGGQGGNGGIDPSIDSGGGGGGGYFGGGGGASTLNNGSGLHALDGVAGGGGGGGSSYVGAAGPAGLGAVSGISSSAGDKALRAKRGTNGQVVLSWFDCGIVTNDGATSGVVGQPQRWAPQPSDEETGAPITPSVFELLDEFGGPVTSVTVPDGVYTIDGSEIVFTPQADFVGTPDPVSYRIEDNQGNSAQGSYSPSISAAGDGNPAVDGGGAELAVTGTTTQAGAAALGLLTLGTGSALLLVRRRRMTSAA